MAALRLIVPRRQKLRFIKNAGLQPPVTTDRVADTGHGHSMNRTQAVHSLRTRAEPKTVLIVEDNELNMKLFHDLLEAHGYDTLQTKDGMEALKLARQHRPDLILMDIQLPEVSGLEVTKWIKEDDELRSIPIIAVTAFAMKGDEEKIREGGCEAYIAKPISVANFLEVVERFLS
jgi:two-component system cell cycle response regulator DivK